MPAPKPGVGVLGGAFYCKKSGEELLSYLTYTSRSDTVERCDVRRSLDNGRAWEDERSWSMRFDDPEGTGRRHPRGGYVDPVTGRYLLIWTEGVLPTDDPLEGLFRWTLHYATSENGDRGRLAEGQIIHDGEEYDSTHHMPGVSVGKNCMMIGDLGCRPLTRSDGVLVVPVQVSPTGKNGFYLNPGGGYTYTHARMLFGTWKPDGSILWTCSEDIKGDPDLSTRGMVEPTIAELEDGKMLCVMRGSNHTRPDLPGHRWYSLSADGGRTWSVPEPWKHTGNAAVRPFYSPSSMSQLLRVSDGRLLWFGNICGENSRGNDPRYPLVAGEVDRRNGLLIEESVEIIDDRMDGESERLTLSNFYVRQERGTGDLLLYLPRAFSKDFRNAEDPGHFEWDLLEYRFSLQ